MEQYKVVITAEAKTDLQRYRDYLLYKIVKNIVYVTNRILKIS